MNDKVLRLKEWGARYTMANKAAKDPLCIFCGSKRCATILYGRIPTTEQIEEDLASGKLVLGGCIVSAGMPTHRCLDCGREWADATETIHHKTHEE